MKELPPLLETDQDRRSLLSRAVRGTQTRLDALSSSACAGEKNTSLRLGVRIRELCDSFSESLRGAAPNLLSEAFHTEVLSKQARQCQPVDRPLPLCSLSLPHPLTLYRAQEKSRTGLSIFINGALFQGLFLEVLVRR